MNRELFLEILNIDSTSGRERRLADFLSERLMTPGCRLERFDVESMSGDVPAGEGVPQNLLFSWGEPKVVFCTHLDTVPPYIPSSGISMERAVTVNSARYAVDFSRGSDSCPDSITPFWQPVRWHDRSRLSPAASNC